MDVMFKRNFNAFCGRYKKGLNENVPDALAERPDWPKDAAIIRRGKTPTPIPAVRRVAKAIHDLDVARQRVESEQLRRAQLDVEVLDKEKARIEELKRLDAEERKEQEEILRKQEAAKREATNESGSGEGAKVGEPANSADEGGASSTSEAEADEGDDDASEGDAGEPTPEISAEDKAAALRKKLAAAKKRGK